MTYAIIQTGGKQLRVEPGRFYDVELLTAEPDQTITLETVLLVQHNSDNHRAAFIIDGATVEGTVMRHLRVAKCCLQMKPKRRLARSGGIARKSLG